MKKYELHLEEGKSDIKAEELVEIESEKFMGEMNSVLENDRLSANTLFNFTNEIQYLTSKIENKFRPRLVVEDYSPLGISLQKAIPMVCFCDIRLSDISAHTAEYGYYGIGLTKKWGIEKELNPVTYITSKNSSFISLFRQLVRDISEKNATAQIKESVMNLFVYFKPYSGYQNNKLRNFYNEREWRYIPTDIGIHNVALGKEEYQNQEIRDSMNEKLFKNTILDFSFDDIKYIILKQESEKDIVAKCIADTFKVSEIDIYKKICFITKEIIEKDL
jgi:hypothetical protein